ncbi:serine/threonine protein kinase [Mastigocoleus testarum]|uniref:Serine/threonine protein kinase n=1 Tax=Mastigocoleus testarum BC008 TaxID=371196 RepID=A0A0V8A060_9CYAN|nr:serine/threonine-protein kinase [Mastigocoleus testarum]KST70138.1 serine/threonine protein kinase [Mastigocoleus testarum BC008]
MASLEYSDFWGNDSAGLRYAIQQQLSKKSGRRTLLARDLNSQELVVIKLLSLYSDFEWDDLKLFEREAEILKRLQHPAIPDYLDYFEVNSSKIKGFALVQTYIPAKNLEQILKAGRAFTELEIKAIAKKLLEILIYLQKQNPPVIHRDLKPSNILLSDRSGNNVGEVYLVDFGSVQTAVASEGATRTVVGTYGYMPPEQFGDRTVPASDLYSLGATLIYLITGYHPADLPQKNFRIQFDHLTTLSSGFVEWLNWLIEPTLEERLAFAHQALKALEKSIMSPRFGSDKSEFNPPQIADLSSKNWKWDGKNWVPKYLHKLRGRSRSNSALTNQNKNRNTKISKWNITQPSSSKIKLKKNKNSLEVVIPPTGFNGSLMLVGLFATAWNSFLFFWTIAALHSPLPLMALFSVPFWGVGAAIASQFLSPLCGRVRLYINQQKIWLQKEILGLKFNVTPPALTKNVNKIVYIPGHLANKGNTGYPIKVPSSLIIWAGVHKYQIGGDAGTVQSDPEIEWLASELSEWFDLPIQDLRNRHSEN